MAIPTILSVDVPSSLTTTFPEIGQKRTGAFESNCLTTLVVIEHSMQKTRHILYLKKGSPPTYCISKALFCEYSLPGR